VGFRDVRHDDSESAVLRRRLAELTREARKNEDAWQRAHRREMALLDAATLGDLLERLTDDLRASYRLAAVTLTLADPEHEIRHLLLGQDRRLADYPDVLFVDSVQGLAPRLAAGPSLGPFSACEHAVLFPANVPLRSVALVPLRRENRLFGSLNLGSDRGDRFTADQATDFLRHLGVIAAFCLENTVNRARLLRSGLTDILTGWHNRRYLESRLREEIVRCRRDRGTLACLMIDVDHFKSINDRYGHLAGDEVLRRVAQRVEAAVRGSDVTARYGGEEFVILLPGTDAEAAELLAERIRRAVAEHGFEIAAATDPVPVTVSIGVAEHRAGDIEDLKLVGERLLARADAALYAAKAGGRNRVAYDATHAEGVRPIMSSRRAPSRRRTLPGG
jgi:diguanylate cyclase (GGDEF)-like protein